ncbi:ComEC/Rec2 family competence protein [Salininema proteolyticum]|uniref:ComEC/Rec2 family competence protein n=1 Tax=Salininema proteolyticum TaxID=1607685 RepID=A0ABV8TVX6_9ACTN
MPTPRTETDAESRFVNDPSDNRLIIAAFGTWAGAAAALFTSGPYGLAVTAAAALAMVFNRGRRHAIRPALSTALFGVILGSTAGGFHVALRDHRALEPYLESDDTIHVEARVSDIPRQSRWDDEKFLIPATLVEIGPGDDQRSSDARSRGPSPATGHWRILIIGEGPEWEALLPGQAISAEAEIWKDDRPDLTAAVVKGTAFTVTRGPPWYARAAHHVRTRLHSAVADLDPAEAGLIAGLALGDRSLMDESVNEAFRDTGLVHLIVTSGYHVGIVVGVLLWGALRARLRPALRAALCLAGIVGFTIIVGPSPSVLRADVMAGMMLLALAVGRPRASPQALASAVILLVLADPDMALDGGFILSVLACVGILAFAFRWADPLLRRGWVKWAALALTIAVSTQLMVTPVLVSWGSGISWISIPVNVMATIVAAPAVALAVAAAALAVVAIPAGQAVATVAAWPIRFLIWLAETGAGVSGAVIPWPEGLAGVGLFLLATLLIWVLWKVRRFRPAFFAVVLIAPLAFFSCQWKSALPEGWLVAACPVGQGDAFVVPGREGGAVVIDAGPDPAAMDRCLDGLGIDRIDLFVVSHFHMDHVGGAAALIDGRTVSRVLVPPVAGAEQGAALVRKVLGQGRNAGPLEEPDGRESATGSGGHGEWNGEPPGGANERRTDTTDGGTPPGRVSFEEATAGQRIVHGRTVIDVLAPGTRPWSGTRSDPNNNSIVLRVTVESREGGDPRSLLFPGDIELEAQQALLRSGVDLSADVLKVPHHGSAYQEEEFLSAVHASIALIGVGEGNRHGHPSGEVIRLLEDEAVRVRRTDTDGLVIVVFTEGRWSLRTDGD